MKIERIDHFVLKVSDIEESCAFYERVLGMEPFSFGEGRWALRFGRHKINLHPKEKGPGLVAAAPSIGGGDFCLITAPAPVPARWGRSPRSISAIRTAISSRCRTTRINETACPNFHCER